MAQKAALVIGAGDGTGGAIAKRSRAKARRLSGRRSADKLQPLVSDRAAGGQVRASAVTRKEGR
jgi:hypothetical protein